MTTKHPLIKLLDKQQELGLALVMNTENYNSPTILKKMGEVLDNGELSPSELQNLCIDILSRVKPI